MKDVKRSYSPKVRLFSFEGRRNYSLSELSVRHSDVNILRRSLTVIFDADFTSNKDVSVIVGNLINECFDLIKIKIGPQFFDRCLLRNLGEFSRRDCITLCYFKHFSLIGIRFSSFPTRALFKKQVQTVASPRLAERAVRLPDRDSQPDHRRQAENSPDDRRYRCKAGFIRCFFSGDGGAPLGAQIGSIVGLCIITGIGIAFGVGPVGRLRRWGWRSGWLLLALGSIGLCGWWLSAAQG